MKKSLFILAIAAVVAVSCGPKDNTLTKAEIEDGWTLLFDGNDLSQWKDYNGTELTNGWKAVNGCMQASGGGSDESGYVVTKKKYADFILSWDWKLTEGGNSGMLYHVIEAPYFAVPYVTGPEYQLIDSEGWDAQHDEKLEAWQKIGTDYAMHLPDLEKMKVNPVGKWNTSKLVFDNGHVEHWLNGVKILEFECWTDEWFALKNSGKWANAPEYGIAREGLICLQDHGYPASFKNIKIKELPHKGGQKDVLFNGKDLTGWEPFGDLNCYVDDEGNLVTENGTERKYGYLCTRKYYKDFDLTVEFKEESNGNSGLFFHSYIEGYNKVNGWQCEVAPKGNDTGGIYESYGRGWLHQIPDEKEEILKVDDWNTLRLRVEGSHVQTWLNGEPMTDLTDDLIGSVDGRLMLQMHDGNDIKVLWRNFDITEL